MGIAWAFVMVAALPMGADAQEQRVRSLYASEPMFERAWPVEFHIRVVEPLNHALAQSCRNFSPDPDLFATKVRTNDVRLEKIGLIGALAQREAIVPLPSRRPARTDALGPLRRWLRSYRRIDRAQLKIITASVPEVGTFRARAKFALFGQRVQDDFAEFEAAVDVEYQRTAAGWRISAFEIRAGELLSAPRLFFEDVTDDWLGKLPPETKKRLSEMSFSDEVLLRLRRGAKVPPRLSPAAMDAHPGAVVADLDHDGFDDLIVWDVLGPAVVLRNVRGRSFVHSPHLAPPLEEISALAVADLDADGMLDFVVGHWFTASSIWWGQAGHRFSKHTGSFPAEVASISIADVDGDQWKDVFFATAAHDHHAMLQARGVIAPDADANVDQVGPMNALYLQRGPRALVGVPLGPEHARNTLQAAFADFDEDGAVDVFLANDFAPANLLTWSGPGFVDAKIGGSAKDIVFAMGASTADFDADGDLDLYVSAMRSTAGRRIMADTQNFDRQLTQSDRSARRLAARGNTLLENRGHALVDVSDGDAFASVRRAGWSYGSQFFDADNDGWLDLYAPSGFLTAPGTAPDGLALDL